MAQRALRALRATFLLSQAAQKAISLIIQGNGEIEPVEAAMRIDTALEAIARIRVDAGRAACTRRPQRIEPGAFEEYIHSIVRNRRGLATHDPAQTNRAAIIRNDTHLFAELVGLAALKNNVFSKMTSALERCQSGPAGEAAKQESVIITTLHT